MQTDQASLEEIPYPHAPADSGSVPRPSLPPVVVSVSDHEAGEDEEEVHGQIPVIELLVQRTGREALEHVIPYHHQGGHSAQPVQNGVVRLGVREGRCGHRSVYGIFHVKSDSKYSIVPYTPQTHRELPLSRCAGARVRGTGARNRPPGPPRSPPRKNPPQAR